MTKRRIGTVLVISVAVVVAGLVLLKLTGGRGSDEGGEVEPDIAVHVGTIGRATLHGYVTGYGTVEAEPPADGRPASGAQVASPESGILTAILCTEGRQVARGAIIFKLDTRLAEEAVAKAEKALGFAETVYERQKKLLAADGTSPKTFQEAEAQRDAARSDLAAARTGLSLLEIKAPVAGTVVRMNAKLGQAVDTNTVLAEVIELDRLAVAARVPSREAARLQPGQTVEADESAGAADAAAGRVELIGRDIDPATDTVLVRVSLPAAAGVKPGQFLRIRIAAEERAGVLAVPEESVVSGPDGGTRIFLVESGKAVPKPVKAGLRESGLVEIEGEGLKEGLVIVTADAYNITTETRVHVIGNK